MNTLTIIALLYLLIMIIRGYRRGFVGMLFSMLFLVLVIVTTAIASPSVTKVFQDSDNVNAYFDKKCSQILAQSNVGDLDSVSLNRGSSPGEVATAAIQLALSIAGVDSIAAEDMKNFLIKLTAMVVTFILSCIVWIIIRIILSRIKKMKVIGTIDKMLGMPVGAAQGLLTIWIFLSFVSMMSFTSLGQRMASLVNESSVLAVLSKYNLISIIIAKFVTKAL